ncbi:2,5-didehydrogluconate reductase DkgB [Ferrimonas balearica]|uniref:2,5-didehydrogluconate reductase DkgB n=1 Tax=Ferrimonas balearica TaxID=44012 RepID=UPI001C994CFB|nr:2,5-didehydrogluconate reductase DkgB [Ferrimonas balearica]MBY5991496.1 2,5-didehydrogluconate reductase DkgB [Ferrimonas balearica]
MTSPLPAMGAGTFRLKEDVAYQSVKTALQLGYRHIDTAQIYGNEAEVGQAIADSGLDRGELFLTTKVWLDNLDPARFIDSVKESLAKLKTDYVDLLLIHWPPKAGPSMEDYLGCLQACRTQGLTRHIGVSNFTRAQMDEAIEILGSGALLTNQVEVHPYLQNALVVDHCEANGIEVTAYMPLAVGKVLSDPVILGIADKHGVTPAQVTLAWVRQLEMATIPSSTKAANLEANLASSNVTLDETDMAQIERLDRGERLANPDFAPDWD